MKFRDTEHETYFYLILDKMQTDDCYENSLHWLYLWVVNFFEMLHVGIAICENSMIK